MLVPVARRGAVRLGITDQPALGKWHRDPTPYLGGIALAVAALVAAAGSTGWERGALLLVAAAIAVTEADNQGLASASKGSSCTARS